MSGTYKNIEMQVLGESGYETIYPVVTTVIEQNKNLQQKFWRGTQAEYDAIQNKDANTMYIVTDASGEPIQSGDMLKSVYDPTGKEQDIFAYALPASEKGVASGVATLDTNGKVPSGQLPSMDYIPTSEKGANSGVATLGSDGKVPSTQLPAMNYAPSTHASQHASGGSDPITPASIGAATSDHTHSNYAASSHNHAASNITSGTLDVARGGTGKSSVTSGNFLVGNGTSALTEKTPAQVLSAIGAASSSHNHAAGNITSGTLNAARIPTLAASKVTTGTFAATDVKAATGTDYTTARVRNIQASTTDLTAGSSSLANGDIYLVYE